MTIAVDSYGPVTDNAQSVYELSTIENLPNIRQEIKRDFGFDLDFDRAKRGATAIFEHTLEVLETADERGESPAAAADHIAERRMAAGSSTIWLPQR